MERVGAVARSRRRRGGRALQHLARHGSFADALCVNRDGPRPETEQLVELPNPKSESEIRILLSGGSGVIRSVGGAFPEANHATATSEEALPWHEMPSARLAGQGGFAKSELSRRSRNVRSHCRHCPTLRPAIADPSARSCTIRAGFLRVRGTERLQANRRGAWTTARGRFAGSFSAARAGRRAGCAKLRRIITTSSRYAIIPGCDKISSLADMDKIVIHGGRPLSGTIRSAIEELRAAHFAATLLTKESGSLHRVPDSAKRITC